jgi:uncharacterized protein (DUF3820 family)
MNAMPNAHVLVELVTVVMPFGKHKGIILYQLPVSYLEWFNREGFPNGKLGTQLQLLYEIKLNGLEHLLTRIKADLKP